MNITTYIYVESAKVYVSRITKMKQFAGKKFYVAFNYHHDLKKPRTDIYTHACHE
jgi:hypothetical protein